MFRINVTYDMIITEFPELKNNGVPSYSGLKDDRTFMIAYQNGKVAEIDIWKNKLKLFESFRHKEYEKYLIQDGEQWVLDFKNRFTASLKCYSSRQLSNDVGCSQSEANYLLSGQLIPNSFLLWKLCALMNIHMSDWLFVNDIVHLSNKDVKQYSYDPKINNNWFEIFIYGFSSRLKSILDEKGFSILSFANECQISRSTMQRYVNGNGIPNAYALKKISYFLNISPNKLTNF